MKSRTNRAVAIIGLGVFLWLLLPPVVKVGPARFAHSEIVKRGEFTEDQKAAIEAGTNIGEEYFDHFVIPAYLWKTVPAAIFSLIASLLLMKGSGEPKKKNENRA